jgi:DNA-directed RNA polymerase sigma subunit (sigma70/sigma32)
MDPIKEAFSKIKDDILSLKEEINKLNKKINIIKSESIKENKPTDTYFPTHNTIPTHQHTDQPTQNTIEIPIKTDKQTNNIHIKSLYRQNNTISTGNKGVPTNKPTHQHTDQPTQNIDFKEVNNMLESLDTIKKEIRLKFKRLTPQEMLVFSTIYTFEEQKYNEITYKLIANQLNLSESSIRDYTNKLINKGIPIEKTKQNNKKILLSISQDLKNIATLATIEALRSI